MNNRIKKPVETPLLTREQMEALAREIASLELDRRAAQTRMDQDKLRVQRSYEVQLSDLREKIDAKLIIAQAWCDAHPEEFGKRKSIEFLAAEKLLSRWTWDKVLDTMQNAGAFWRSFIRTKSEIDKEAIIAKRDQLEPQVLAEIGVKVAQDDSFYIEPKIEAFPDRLKEAA